MRVEHVTVLRTPVPGRRQGGSAVQKKSLYPRLQVGPGPGDDAEGRGLGLPSFKEAGAVDQTSLRDKSAEGQAEPRFLSSAGRCQESNEGRPGQGDLVRVSKQGSHGT